MKSYLFYAHSDRQTSLFLKSIAKTTLFFAGFVLAAVGSNVAQAQSGLSGAINGNSMNFDDAQIYGTGFLLDSGGSQQFFRQNNSRLYFLPKKSESNSILEIDETIESEELEEENLQQPTEDILPQTIDE